MPRGMPKDVKNMTAYSTQPKTTSDVADCLKSHFKGYIEWKGLDEILAKLPVKLQKTINIVYGEWRTYEEAAEVMGCSVDTVNRHLREARRRILEECHD